LAPSTVAVDCIDGDVSCMWWDVAVVLQASCCCDAAAVATSYAEVQVVVLIVYMALRVILYLFFITIAQDE
jgi:hypothetical protein